MRIVLRNFQQLSLILRNYESGINKIVKFVEFAQ